MFKDFLNWMVPSFSGDDGKGSIRRIIATLISLSYIFCSTYFVMYGVNDEYRFYTILTLSVTFLILFQIIYPFHLIEAIKAYKTNIPTPKPESPPTDPKNYDITK